MIVFQHFIIVPPNYYYYYLHVVSALVHTYSQWMSLLSKTTSYPTVVMIELRNEGVELLNTLFLYTAVIVAALYMAAGTLMFIVNRKWKFFYLPLLYAIFGVIIGCCYGYILCMRHISFHHL